MMEGVRRRDRRVVTQPVDDREAMAGRQATTPFTTVPVAVNEDDVISIRKIVHNELPSVKEEATVGDASSVTLPSDDDSGMVVDMREVPPFGGSVKVRQQGVSEKDLSIKVRRDRSTCSVTDQLVDLKVREDSEYFTEKQKGFVKPGDGEEIVQMLDGERPSQKGVICNDKVLHSEGGMYQEGLQYQIIPGTESKGAYGEAAMCQDLNTQRSFIRKKVQGKLSKNEVKVPLAFKGNVGIPEVYGVIMNDDVTEIFQEFAGLSLKKLCESEYAGMLRDPKALLLLAFQAFATLDKLHSQGVTHQDIKPENVCLDTREKGWRLKFIDFGSSQTPQDQVIEGLTNEYLSPESCSTILQVAKKELSKEEGRLGRGTDVWATALSLLYCLCGYHVMIYVCFGDTMYRETDPLQLQHKRMQCLWKICSLKDDDIRMKLIRQEWPDPLKYLLYNTLRVNPKDRWTARQASQFILMNLAQRSPSAPAVQKPAPPAQPSTTPAPAAACGFTGLSPAKLVVRSQAVQQRAVQPTTSQVAQNNGGTTAVQCTSPTTCTPATSPTPDMSSAQLPAFTDLLSDELSKKATRPYKRRQREGPYPQPAGRGCKVIKK